MAANLGLVPATAGKRLDAAVLDWLAPVAVLVVTFAVGFAGITRTQSGGFIIYDTGSLILFGGIGIGLGLTLAYLVVMAGMEGRSGKTIGNQIMGNRCADKDGYASGGGGVFLRGLITGAGIILTLLAAVAIVIFKWFDVAVFILGPMLLLGAVWAVLVVVSNTWDGGHGSLRGWQAVNAQAPVPQPPVQPRQPPAQRPAAQKPAVQQPAPAQPYAPQPSIVQPSSGPPTFSPQPYAPPSSTPFQAPHVVPPAPAPAAEVHPDDDLDRTQMRAGATYSPPVAVLRIKLDDGRDFQLDRNVLVGRNPVAQAGEQQAQLLAVDDPGRSISKTHLHLLTDGAGIWVTDGDSTNGSALTTPDGRRTPLQPGVPAFVSPGSTVRFGDRSFHLGQV